MRAILLPITIKGQLATAKMQSVKPQITPIQERLQKAKRIGDQVACQKETQNMVKVFRENNINPLVGFLGLVQIPFFISFFIATNKMGNAQIPGFANGGFGWLSNLSAPDPLYIAPLAVPFLAWWTMVIQEKGNPGSISPMIKTVMLGAMVLGLYFTISLPASIYYYLIPSILMTALQTMLFNHSRFRTAVGLPPLVKASPLTHDKVDLRSVAAARPMTFSEALKEAKEAASVVKN
jgi:YidC/Oxa1 family membrane protein insertase